MKFLKLIPWILAGLHALLTIVVFLVGNLSSRAGLLPIIVYAVDYPCSALFIEPLRHAIPHEWGSTKVILDATLYLLLGSVWFYSIGVLIKLGLARLSNGWAK